MRGASLYEPFDCLGDLFDTFAFRSDLYNLDVSSIVGPPYAVQSLEPANGPVTGLCFYVREGRTRVRVYASESEEQGFVFVSPAVYALCMCEIKHKIDYIQRCMGYTAVYTSVRQLRTQMNGQA